MQSKRADLSRIFSKDAFSDDEDDEYEEKSRKTLAHSNDFVHGAWFFDSKKNLKLGSKIIVRLNWYVKSHVGNFES